MKVNLGKAKEMVCGRITKDGMSRSKPSADPSGVCSSRLKSKAVIGCLWELCKTSNTVWK